MTRLKTTVKTTLVRSLWLWMLLAFAASPLRAQCDNTLEGHDFWLMFLPNLAGYGEMSLKIYAPDNTQIHIACPRLSWDTTINVATARQVVVPIRRSLGGGQYSDTPTNHGFHVTSTRPISLYSSFYDYASFDIATIFPTDVLDTSYVVQIYPSFNCSSVGFLAVEDSTWLTMTLPCCTMHPNYSDNLCVDSAGTVRTVFLRQGQCFHLAASRNADLSGMRVTSNGKRFASFQGAICANVPSGCGACDHLYEQTVPERYWGRRFVIVPTALQVNGDRVRITSASDSNQIVLNGTLLTTLMAGETYEVNVNSDMGHYLETSRPAYVCLYIKGHGCSGGPGDPAAVTIPPVEQGVRSVHFQAITTSLTTSHYVNIVTRTVDTAGMRIDGQPLTIPFIPMDCGYSYVRLPVDAGSHHLSSTSGTFEAFFYGLGNYESYAYLAGMAMHDLRNRLLVNGIEISDDNSVCAGSEAELRLLHEDGDLTVHWFVDGQQVGGDSSVLHYVFDSVGRHRVDAALPDYCDTVSTFVTVRPPDTVTLYRTLCEGDSLLFADMVIVDSGNYSMTISSSTGCDTLALLKVSLLRNSIGMETDTVCSGMSYSWHGMTLDTVGLYVDTLQAANGCDSVVTLQLSNADWVTVPIDTSVDCATNIYILSANLSEADSGTAFGWRAEPPDALLTGHEYDTVVRVSPHDTTCYRLALDHRCPLSDSVVLGPFEEVHAVLEVVPTEVTVKHPDFDAYDRSIGTQGRLWLLDGVEQPFIGNPLQGSVDTSLTTLSVGLVVWNRLSCRDTAYVSVHLSPEETIWCPNVFTPDGDINNRFAIIGVGVIQMELDIYNRWGLLVFHSDHPEEGWDGTHNGIPCKQEAYVWRLKYRRVSTPDAYNVKVGTVTLLR